MIDVAAFRTRFPEFTTAAYPDAQVTLALNDTIPLIDPARWDDLYDMGTAYLAAHELVMAGVIAKTPLTDDKNMKKAGDVQAGRDSMLMNAQAKNPYLRTAYGQKYLYYRNIVGSGAVSV